MSILIVPTQYQRLQEAINAAIPGDEINILPDTTLVENIQIIGKDNISILGLNKTVVLDGSTIGGTAALIESNNVTIRGMVFQNFDQGVVIIGNENIMMNVTSKKNDRSGFVILGNYNQVIESISDKNGSVGIDLSGNYNQVIATRLDSNQRGVTATSGEVIGNIFYKNIFINNFEFGARIASTNADKCVFIENTINGSQYGLLINFGSVAVIANYFNNINNTGLSYKDNNGLILENTFVMSNVGMYLEICNSLVASNTTQTGKFIGINVSGNDNVVIRNITLSYEGTGLLVNGCSNIICNNISQNNGENKIISGDCNIENCNCRYCAALGCKDKFISKNNTNYLGFLDLFKNSVGNYYNCKGNLNY